MAIELSLHIFKTIENKFDVDEGTIRRVLSAELKARLRDIALKEARDAERDAGIRGKLNVQVWILTDYWMGLRRAEPIFYTTLRDGISLYDRGMFAPWKLMLKKGNFTKITGRFFLF